MCSVVRWLEWCWCWSCTHVNSALKRNKYKGCSFGFFSSLPTSTFKSARSLERLGRELGRRLIKRLRCLIRNNPKGLDSCRQILGVSVSADVLTEGEPAGDFLQTGRAKDIARRDKPSLNHSPCSRLGSLQDAWLWAMLAWRQLKAAMPRQTTTSRGRAR